MVARATWTLFQLKLSAPRKGGSKGFRHVSKLHTSTFTYLYKHTHTHTHTETLVDTPSLVSIAYFAFFLDI